MEAIAGVVILAQFVLAAVVGVRLLRLPTTESMAPERLLGLFFVVGQFAGGALVTAAYAGWQAHGSGTSPTWVVQTHAVGQLLMGVGYSCLIAFTWRTFSRDQAWAMGLCGLGVAAMCASYAGRVTVEGFAISVDPGFHHWLAYGVRMAALVWMGTAAVFYWLQMRRRMKLGLADPLVTNRLALWAIFAFMQGMTALSEPMARLAYGLIAGDTAGSADGVQNVAGSVIHLALLFSSFWGSGSVAVLFLTFFPTESYARWVRQSGSD